MQTHQLKPIHSPQKPQRKGRGGKSGTYSGRGIKGQNSRAGHKMKPIIRELIKRYPKLRGHKFKSPNLSAKSHLVVLNLDILEKKFNAGDKVSPETLLQKKLIRTIEGKLPEVKILSKGKIIKALTFENCLASKQARENIIKAGGKI
ncbi:MAG: uL15 family ribosomal protein [bacterium]|nr:uL15 family ribosomal protein [bacterium]